MIRHLYYAGQTTIPISKICKRCVIFLNMDLHKTIDVIIEQEHKEIKNYNLFAFSVIICFLILLCYNLINGYIKDIAAALTNFLTLAVGYIPFQQIVKRRKKIKYFDQIVRTGVAEDEPDRKEFAEMIKKAIENGLKD